MSTETQSAPVPVRFLGTTWRRRGVRYWLRRASLLILWTLVFALSVWGVSILFSVVATTAAGTARIVVLTLMSLAVIGSFVWGFSLMRRSEEEKKLGVPMIMRAGTTAEQRRDAAWRGYGLGLVAGPLVLVSQMFVVGVLAAIVLSLMQKYISIEEFEAATGRKAPPRVKRPSVWSQMRHRG